MIITLLISIILNLISVIFIFLPVVTIADLPYFGEQISSTLVWAISTWNAFLITFPYAETAWHIFLWIILPFEVTMLVAKFFIGHRLPAQQNN